MQFGQSVFWTVKIIYERLYSKGLVSKQELRFSMKLDGHGTQEKRSVGVILT